MALDLLLEPDQRLDVLLVVQVGLAERRVDRGEFRVAILFVQSQRQFLVVVLQGDRVAVQLAEQIAQLVADLDLLRRRIGSVALLQGGQLSYLDDDAFHRTTASLSLVVLVAVELVDEVGLLEAVLRVLVVALLQQRKRLAHQRLEQIELVQLLRVLQRRIVDADRFGVVRHFRVERRQRELTSVQVLFEAEGSCQFDRLSEVASALFVVLLLEHQAEVEQGTTLHLVAVALLQLVAVS